MVDLGSVLPMYVYNSLTGKKEIFRPMVPKRVGMYVCGPTLYSHVHLGNCRTFVSFDMIFRYLKHLGYKVRYVRNITDVGHLENDADVGEDKIIKKARLEQLEPMEVVQRYTVDFHRIMERFNALPPSIEPTATGHIIEQIEIVKNIVNQGFAYEIDGSVYFDIEKYQASGYHYGELSKRNLDELLNYTRNLSGQAKKKNPQDFALWKKAEKQHIMQWPSPWGQGFPGWHIECTAMSTKYLGTHFDIHGGGIDLKFPHHECEIAQATAANQGENPVSYWLHTNMLTINGKKMSKSSGNSLLPEDLFNGKNKLFSKGFSAVVVRFFMMQAHYRSVLDFSEQALLASEKGFLRLVEGFEKLKNITPKADSSFSVDDWINRCYQAMNDDFNTPILIAELFEAIKKIYELENQKESLNEADLEKLHHYFSVWMQDILGLDINKITDNKQTNEIHSKEDQSNENKQLIELLIDLRNQARKNKDFKLSDQIRDALQAQNIRLKDEKDGQTQYEKTS